MLRQLEQLRRAASESLRSAYEAAIGSLDGVVYRLAMLRALDTPKLVRYAAEVSNATPPPPAPKATTPTRAAVARISATRKRRR
jgi:hypothetical protein